MKRRTHLLFYLLLNVIVSAATILVVLVIWDQTHPGSPPFASGQLPVIAPVATSAPGDVAPVTATAPAPTPGPTETLPPVGTPVIEIVSVIGPGDLDSETVMLRRVGDGNLRMDGWKLTGEHDNAFTFPTQPELILYKGGAVQIYSKIGTDTATEIYWNREKAAWRSGETIRLVDPQGGERASYKVP